MSYDDIELESWKDGKHLEYALRVHLDGELELLCSKEVYLDLEKDKDRVVLDLAKKIISLEDHIKDYYSGSYEE